MVMPEVDLGDQNTRFQSELFDKIRQNVIKHQLNLQTVANSRKFFSCSILFIEPRAKN